MKSKIIKMLGIAVFCGACFYILRNWHVFDESSLIEPKSVELSQCNLEISELTVGEWQPIWYARNENPTVAYSIIFRNEGKKNFAQHPGILKIIDNTLLDGAGQYSSSGLKEVLIDNNIRLSIDFTSDDAVVDVYTVARNFDLSIDIVADILTQAHLKVDNLEANKQKVILGLKQSKFSGDAIAAEKLTQVMFKKGHPYYVNLDEAIKKIPTYTKDDVDSCYKQLFNPKNAMINVVGSLDQDVIEKGFSRLLKTLSVSKKNDFKDSTQQVTFDNLGEIYNVNLDTSQSTIIFALPGVSRTSPDSFAYRLANMVLGGHSTAFTNRLFKDVRDTHGLAYGIYTYTIDNDLLANIQGVARTSPKNVDKLISRVKKIVSDFVANGITEEELNYHKLACSALNALESSQKIVSFLNSCRMDGIKAKYVNNYMNNYYNLKLEEVNGVIKKVFKDAQILFVVAGKTSEQKGDSK